MDVGTLVLRKFSSQCALWMPIGDTSRRKILRYQQTARNVLKRGVGGLPLNVPGQTPDFGIQVRPARSILSNVLNFCRSASPDFS